MGEPPVEVICIESSACGSEVLATFLLVGTTYWTGDRQFIVLTGPED